MLTDKNLVTERAHLGGAQRIYRLGNFGLSVVNSPMLHSWKFAWEAAVLEFRDHTIDSFDLRYDTPLTEDVMVFMDDEETNEFIEKAMKYFKEVEREHSC